MAVQCVSGYFGSDTNDYDCYAIDGYLDKKFIISVNVG